MNHFKLRKGSDVKVFASTEHSVGVKVIHAVAIVAAIGPILVLGAFFMGSLRGSVGGETPVYPEFAATNLLDKYRGYKDVKCPEATGYFSLQQVSHSSGVRWTMCTPEGNAFTPSILNKVHTGNVDDSDVYKEKYDGSKVKWARDVIKLMDDLKFNMVGFSSEVDALRKSTVERIPYSLIPPFVPSENSERFANKDYPDVFSDEYKAEAESIAATIAARYGSDPYFALAYISNETNFCLQLPDGSDNPTAIWAREILEPEGVTPAKTAWVEKYKELYSNDIAALNKVYEKTYVIFDDMYADGPGLYDRFADGVPEGAGEDAERAYNDYDAWNAMVGGKFHEVSYNALKAKMPNLLVSTDKHRQCMYSPAYLKAIAPYSDIFAMNHYATVEQVAPSDYTINDYATQTGLPVLIAEHSFAGGVTCGINDDGAHYPEAVDQPARAAAHLAYRDKILKNKNVISSAGWHEYSDFKVTNPDNLCGFVNFGVVNTDSEPWDEFISTAEANWTNFNVLRWQAPLDTNVGQGLAPITPSGTDITQESASPVVNHLADKAPKPSIIANIFKTAVENPETRDVKEIRFTP